MSTEHDPQQDPPVPDQPVAGAELEGEQPDLEPIAVDEVEPDDESGEAHEPAHGRGRNAIIAGVAVAVIAAAALFGVRAASGNKANATSTVNSTQTPGAGNGGPTGSLQRRPGTFGTISSISGSTLTVKGADGTITNVNTTSATTVTKSATGSLSDVKVGDHVNVNGTGTSTEIAAQRVTDSGNTAPTNGPAGGGPGGGGGFGNGGPPPNGGNGSGTNTFAGASGTVKSISGSTITLETSTGTTVTATTSASTTVSITTQSTVSALAVGDQVAVVGTAGNNAVTATSIREGSIAGGFRGGPGGGNGGPGTGTGTPQSSTGQTT